MAKTRRFLGVTISILMVYMFVSTSWSNERPLAGHSGISLDNDMFIKLGDERKILSEAANDPNVEIKLKKAKEQNLPTSMSLMEHVSTLGALRDQQQCGNCYVWATTAAMEIALSEQHNVKKQLSIQYFNSCDTSGKFFACKGGTPEAVASWYRTRGAAVPWSNVNASFADQKGGDSSAVTCDSIPALPSYPIASITTAILNPNGLTQDEMIDHIKNQLNQGKGVAFAFQTLDKADWDAFDLFWRTKGENDLSWDTDKDCGKKVLPDSGGQTHVVLIVGYNDDDKDPAKHYWIVLNSWGLREPFAAYCDLDHKAVPGDQANCASIGGKWTPADSGRPNGTFFMKQQMKYDCKLNFQKADSTWEKRDVRFFDVISTVFNTFSITGTVKTGNGSPMNGVPIDLGGDAVASTTTDSQFTNMPKGSYSFNGLPNGSYTVTPNMGGSIASFAPATGNVTLNNRSEVMNFAEGMWLSGNVRGHEFPAAASAMMHIKGPVEQTTQTNSSGYYVFTGLPDGAYTLSGSVIGPRETWLFPPTMNVIVKGGYLADQNFSEGYALSGILKTAQGIAISGASLSLSGGNNASVVSDTNGAFKFIDVVPGTYSIGAAKLGFDFQSCQGTVKDSAGSSNQVECIGGATQSPTSCPATESHGSCITRNGASLVSCFDYTGSAWTEALIVAHCEPRGVHSLIACNQQGLAASCKISRPDGLDFIIQLYNNLSPPVIEKICTGARGTICSPR